MRDPGHRQNRPRAPEGVAPVWPGAGVRLAGLAPVIAGLVLGLGPALSAQEGALPEITGVQVGIGGCYKAGLWTPVKVGFGGLDEDRDAVLTVTVPDGDGVPHGICYPLRRWAVAGDHGGSAALVYARIGRVEGDLTVEVRRGTTLLAEKAFRAAEAEGFPPALASGRRLFVVVGAESPGVREAVRLQRRRARTAAVVATVKGFQRLPTRWYGYEAVDTVVLGTSRAGAYAGLEAGDPRIEALDRWVRLGGTLMLSVGEGVEALGDEKHRWALAPLVPGDDLQVVRLRQISGLEAYAGSSTPIPGLGRGGQIPVARLIGVRGRIEAREGNVPLVVRTAHGFGQIVFLGADLDHGPIARWPDRSFLVARLLDLPTQPLEGGRESTAVMHYGYTDLAGQLRSALDRFPGVSLVPFYGVVLLILLYFLLIGPGDYFFLRKVIRRTQFTWLTFPLIVGAASAGAYALAYHAKGQKLQLSQADLVDFDCANRQVRGTTWANLFSPRMDRYNITFRPTLPGSPRLADSEEIVSWLGLTGNALGGMDPHTAQPSTWRDRYQILADGTAIHGLPVPVWSTKSITVRWNAAAESRLQADIHLEDQLPVGKISNGFPFPLADCILAFDRWAYELGTIRPGQTVQVGRTSKRRGLRALLTGQKLVFAEAEKARQRATPYDQASVDLRYILRAMMFYDAAGGQRYTGMENQYQPFADLSDLLKTDRALLVAYPPDDPRVAAGYLLRDGKPLANPRNRRVTVFRFVLPIKPAGES